MKIIHISDLHILEIKATPLDFLNKRIIGGLNIYFNRKGEYLTENVEKLFNDINKQKFDHIIITGDFTNLALPSEFKKAKELLEMLGDHSKISIVPGNHDSYTRKAFRKKYFQKYFDKWLINDLKVEKNKKSDKKFPYVRLLDDNIAVIGFNTSITSCCFCSAGKISNYQIKEFEKMMESSQLKDRYKIVLIHQDLKKVSKFEEWSSGIRDRKKIVKLFSKHKIDLVLHGHRHYNTEYQIDEENYKLKIIETAASARYTKNSSGSYSIYEIKENEIKDRKVRYLDFKTKEYRDK